MLNNQTNDAIIGALVHTFRFAALQVCYTRFPPQPTPDVVSAPHRAIIIAFTLARIRQILTIPTGQYWTAIENCNAPPAFTVQAEKPRPSTTKVVARPIEQFQYHAVNFRSHLNGWNHYTVTWPPPAEGPALQEAITLQAARNKAKILSEISGSSAFKVQSFDQNAAIEVALLTDADLQSGKKLKSEETKAKVKFDCQIIAIAKVNNVKTIYSDDIGLGKTARSNGICVVETRDLPLPQLPPQGELAFLGKALS